MKNMNTKEQVKEEDLKDVTGGCNENSGTLIGGRYEGKVECDDKPEDIKGK